MGASAGGVRAGRAFVEIGIKDSFTNGLKAAEKRLKSFGTGISVIGASMAGIGAAGVGAIAGITSVFGGFDAQMAKVRANTGSSGAELEQLRDLAKQMGANTQFSATQAAEGMNLLATAGLNAKEIMAALPATLSLAAAGGIELGEASDIAANVSGAFGLAADEIGRVADVIATTANVSTTGVLEMGETFKYVAPLAKVAGQSIEEMAAASAILASNGTKGSMAGTDLKGILSKLSTTDVQDQLKALGVSVVDASGKMRPMMDIMRDYGEATKSMKDTERIASAVDLFGEISAKSAIALSNAGSKVDEMRSKMLGAEGAATTMASVMTDNLGGAVVSFKSALESVVIELGEALAPTIRTVIDTSSNLLRVLSGFIKNNKTLVISFFGAAVAIGAVGTAIATVGGLIALTGAIVGGFVTLISAASAVIAALGWPVAILAAVVAVLGAALAAGVVYFFAFTEGGRQMVAALMDRFGALWNYVKPILGAITEALKRGDWAAAAQIAWAGLKAVFWKGAAQIDNIVLQLTVSMVKIFTKGLYKLTIAAQKFTIQFAMAMAKLSVGDFGKAASMLNPTSMGKMLAGMNLSKGLSDFNKYSTEQAKKADAELKALMARNAAADAPVETPVVPDEPSLPAANNADLEKALAEAKAKADGEATKLPDIGDGGYAKMLEEAMKEAGEIPEIEAIDMEAALGKLSDVPSGENVGGNDAFGGQAGAGTFSSYAAALMGTGTGPMDRVARATEKSKETLEKIDRNMDIVAKKDALEFVA